MFSSGWIWLVSDGTGQLGIVPTFGSGTLLIRSSQPSPTFLEWQRLVGDAVVSHAEFDQAPPPLPSATPSSAHTHVDAPPHASSPVSGITHNAPPLDPHTPVRSMSTYHARPKGVYQHPDELQPLNHTKVDFKKIGETLYPLLCVSVHEHAWVGAGYGVWGKEEYMKRFWTVVDWEKVKTLYDRVPGTKKRV